jgi:SAM-dependent methyltransferase
MKKWLKQFRIKKFHKLDFFTPNYFDDPLSCTSQICNQYFWNLPFYQYWCEQLKEKPRMHRKQWEWIYVAQVLFENGFLKQGNKGLCFAAGQEPLPALFASLGCEITATDLDINTETAKAWSISGQNTENNIKNLNKNGICRNDLFERNVQFRSMDMNNIPDDLADFDFNWSCCAFEHLGGIKQGLDFLANNLKTLRPGGIAVHTSEFNLTSDEETLETKDLCIFRRRDCMEIADKLRQMGHYVYPLDFRKGNEPLDNFVDIPPYQSYDNMNFHLRLKLSNFVSTSFGIIVKKGG